MKVPIEVVVDVDPDAWARKFNIGIAKVPVAVEAYFAGVVYKELSDLGLGIRVTPTVHPGAREFRDDDAGYLAWLAAHPNGYVINIARSHSATEARVHHAGCRTISGENPREGAWTGPYVKVCAEHLAELEQWAINQVGEPIPPCGTCHPARHAVQPASTSRTEQAVAPPVPKGRCEIHGPAADSAVVEAWADDYIRFERRPVWQEQLRDEIRSRCQHLEPSAGQVLHATFFGAKHPNADVENLALYYIDSFKVVGRNGIRFEHGAAVRRLPTVPSIRSVTATRSRHGRAPSPTGSRGERWPRSTGPTWARSLATRNWPRFG